MPSAWFEDSMSPLEENAIEGESLMFYPWPRNNKYLGLTNGEKCNFIPFETCCKLSDDLYESNNEIQLVFYEHNEFKCCRFDVSTIDKNTQNECLVFKVSFEKELRSGEFKYSHEYIILSQDFTFSVVDMKVALEIRKVK